MHLWLAVMASPQLASAKMNFSLLAALTQLSFCMADTFLLIKGRA
jgi:hypothetical protein